MVQATTSTDEVANIQLTQPYFNPLFSAHNKLAFDTNGIHEVAAHLLLRFFMKCPAAVALNERIALKSKSYKSQKEDTESSYCDTVNYLLETYATDYVMANTDPDIMQLAQSSCKSPTEYVSHCVNRA